MMPFKIRKETIILIFNFDGKEEILESKRNKYMKDIIEQYLKTIKRDHKNCFFLYKGSMVKEELKIEEINNEDNEIKILVYEIEDNDKCEEKLKNSKYIICPRCKEICFMNINNYKINLFNCKNNHCFSNLLLNELNDFQKIDESNIKCNKCNINKSETTNNKFYKCLDCNINLCPLCNLSHNKNHKIIDYEVMNNCCNNHGERYISYCKDCNQNLCDICDFSKHNINFLYKFKNDKESIFQLKNKLEDLKKENIDSDKKLSIIIENIELYYNMVNNILHIYKNTKNKNYQLLMNINNLNKYNQKIIEDIEKLKNKKNKSETISDLYKNMIIDNEIILNYKIEKEHKIRIFGDKFVNKNKNNFQIIINNKNYELISIVDIKKLDIKSGNLEVHLKQLKNILDISFMFCGCKSLLSIDNITNWNMENIINMPFLFNSCSSLKSLPDISKWNINNVSNMSGLFQGCSSLSSLPDISKWNTNNVSNISSLFHGCSSLS